MWWITSAMVGGCSTAAKLDEVERELAGLEAELDALTTELEELGPLVDHPPGGPKGRGAKAGRPCVVFSKLGDERAPFLDRAEPQLGPDGEVDGWRFPRLRGPTAAEAGLRDGDLVLAMAGVPLRGPDSQARVLAAIKEAGPIPVPLTVRREDGEHTLAFEPWCR